MSPLSLFFAMFALMSLSGVIGSPSCAKGSHCGKRCIFGRGWPFKNGTSSGPTLPGPCTPPVGTYTSSPSVPSGAPASSSISTTSSHTPTSTPSSTPAPSSTPPSSGFVSARDVDFYLSAHDAFRGLHDALPLTWNDTLSEKAQEWANRCIYKPSDGVLGDFGENVGAGGIDLSILDVVKFWAAEAPQYDPKNPKGSHFTQVVWKATTQVGCAVQSCTGIFPGYYGAVNLYVCEYYPRGNVPGQFAQNVQV